MSKLIALIAGAALCLSAFGGAHAYKAWKKNEKKNNTIRVSPNGQVITDEMYAVLDAILIEQEQRQFQG